MLNSRAARSWLFAAVLATSFTALAVPVEAATGAVRVRIVKMGFIIGAGGGEGVLTYRGRAYPFTVSGIGVGVVVGAAVVGGVRATRLQNANGVVLELQGGQVGLELSVGVSGVTIAMR